MVCSYTLSWTQPLLSSPSCGYFFSMNASSMMGMQMPTLMGTPQGHPAAVCSLSSSASDTSYSALIPALHPQSIARGGSLPVGLSLGEHGQAAHGLMDIPLPLCPLTHGKLLLEVPSLSSVTLQFSTPCRSHSDSTQADRHSKSSSR